jgi:hypothetical protein
MKQLKCPLHFTLALWQMKHLMYKRLPKTAGGANKKLGNCFEVLD